MTNFSSSSSFINLKLKLYKILLSLKYICNIVTLHGIPLASSATESGTFWHRHIKNVSRTEKNKNILSQKLHACVTLDWMTAEILYYQDVPISL